MKMAKVVAVRDVPSANDDGFELNRTGRRKAMEALLRRYPQVSEAESAEILRFLSTGPHLEVGLVAGNDELAPKVAAFKREHQHHFRLKPWEVLTFLFVTLGPVLVLAYIYL